MEQWGCNQQSNQQFAYSQLLAATSGSSGPTSSPTPSPSASSGSGSSSQPSLANGGLVNGYYWQHVNPNFVPFASTSTWNQQIPSNPQIASTSAQIVARNAHVVRCSLRNYASKLRSPTLGERYPLADQGGYPINIADTLTSARWFAPNQGNCDFFSTLSPWHISGSGD